MEVKLSILIVCTLLLFNWEILDAAPTPEDFDLQEQELLLPFNPKNLITSTRKKLKAGKKAQAITQKKPNATATTAKTTMTKTKTKTKTTTTMVTTKKTTSANMAASLSTSNTTFSFYDDFLSVKNNLTKTTAHKKASQTTRQSTAHTNSSDISAPLSTTAKNLPASTGSKTSVKSTSPKSQSSATSSSTVAALTTSNVGVALIVESMSQTESIDITKYTKDREYLKLDYTTVTAQQSHKSTPNLEATSQPTAKQYLSGLYLKSTSNTEAPDETQDIEVRYTVRNTTHLFPHKAMSHPYSSKLQKNILLPESFYLTNPVKLQYLMQRASTPFFIDPGEQQAYNAEMEDLAIKNNPEKMLKSKYITGSTPEPPTNTIMKLVPKNNLVKEKCGKEQYYFNVHGCPFDNGEINLYPRDRSKIEKFSKHFGLNCAELLTHILRAKNFMDSI